MAVVKEITPRTNAKPQSAFHQEDLQGLALLVKRKKAVLLDFAGFTQVFSALPIALNTRLAPCSDENSTASLSNISKIISIYYV